MKKSDYRPLIRLIKIQWSDSLVLVSLIMASIFLASCSSIPKTFPIAQKVWVKSIDMNGNGKGSFNFFNKEKTSFSFESLNEEKNKKWIIAVRLAFYGEEVIYLDYKSAPKLFGPGIDKLKGEVKEDEVMKRSMESFGQNMGRAFQLFENLKKKDTICNKSECLSNGIKWKISYHEDTVILSKDHEANFEIGLKMWKNGKFQMVEFYQNKSAPAKELALKVYFP